MDVRPVAISPPATRTSPLGETNVSTVLRSVVFAGAMAAPLASQAAAPTLSDVLGASGISASGVIDASWDYADTDGGPVGHQFDVSRNAFSLHQVNLLIAKQPAQGVGFVLNPILGDDAKITGANGDDFDLFQGFVQYATGGATFSLGRFATLCGMEVANPAGNINASRSILFFNQPFVHTGARAAFKLSDAFTLTGSVINSHNNSAALTSPGFYGKTDNNTSKSIELQAGFAPSSAFSLYLTGHSGDEDAQVGQGTLRSDVVDLVVNLNVTDSLYFGVNADYFQQEGPAGGTVDARGVAGYTNVKFGPARVAVRAEYVDVDDQAGGRGYLREQTVTLGYGVTPELELLVEGRNDQVDTAFLAFNPRDVNVTPNNDQTTATIKAIYKF